MSTESVKSQSWHIRNELSAIRGTIVCTVLIIFLDVVLSGSYLFAVPICPIWFLVAVVRAVMRPSSAGVVAARILIPIVTLLLVIANSSLQSRIAMVRSARVIEACEQYQKANGSYPERLGDLVPRYLSSILNAKYCLAYGEFMYFGSPHPMLVWCELPPFGRRAYNFERSSWGYID
jgi:hypothetical protein